MPYEFLEDMATADIAFRAWGQDLEETSWLRPMPS